MLLTFNLGGDLRGFGGGFLFHFGRKFQDIPDENNQDGCCATSYGRQRANYGSGMIPDQVPSYKCGKSNGDQEHGNPFP